MVGIDLNLPLNFGQYTFIDILKGLASAYRTNSFLTVVRLSAQKDIRQVFTKISRKPSNKNLFMLRSIPVHGFCSDNLTAKPSGHRNLPESDAAKTLSLWNSWKCFSQHSGKGKRKSRLENICRFRTSFDKQGSNTLRPTKTSVFN